MKRFWRFWDRFGVLVILLTIALVFLCIEPKILAPSQIATVLGRAATVGIAASGMLFAIVAGGFDLSVGSIVSLVSCIIATSIKGGMLLGASLLLGLVVGAGCGFINGIIITKLKIQTFVATLATQLAFAGAALVYSNGAITSLTGSSPIKFLVTYRLFGVLSLQIVLMVVFFALAFLLYRFTSFGIRARAIGSNEAAARTSGIEVDGTLILIFVITGVTAAGAAALFTSRLASANPIIGVGFELDVITSVILGGTALSGGKGNVWGTMVGAILLAFVQMGLNILGVGEAYQKLAVALVLLFALAVNGVKQITFKEEERHG